MVPDGESRLCVFGIAVGLFCVVAAAAVSKPGLEPGQRWQYRLEGPRPGSDGPEAIDGERIQLVTAGGPGQGGGPWVIEERFTNDQKSTSRSYVDASGLLTTLEFQNDKGQKMGLRYDPPVPYRPADMEVGQSRTVETTARMDAVNFAVPTRTVVERLPDEAVSTPTGEFAGCTHFKSTLTMTMDIKIAKIAIREEREQWYHPSVRGMVKEVYRKDPVSFFGRSRPGYTATSTLMAYGKEAVEAGTGPLPPSGVGPAEQPEPNRFLTIAFWGLTHLRLLAVLGVLVLGACVWALARRFFRRRLSRAPSRSDS